MPMQPLAFAARLLLAFSLIPVALAATPAPAVKAPQVDNPTRVLFVGNSYFYYNDSLHNHVQRMVAAADSSMDGRGTSIAVC